MRTAVFAGIQAGLVRRLKRVLEGQAELFREWQFRYVETQGKEPRLLVRDRLRVYSIAMQNPSVHVLGLSVERDRRQIAAEFESYFRFRWIDLTPLWSISTEDPWPFLDMLLRVIAEEDQWATRVRPQTLDSALMLPGSSFRCCSPHEQMWRRAMSYGDPDCVPSAEKAIRAFENAYYRRVEFQKVGESRRAQRKWVDDINLVFHDKGERHGVAPPPRDWKYSYYILPGFHFDVTQVDRLAFALTDAEGVRHEVPSKDHPKHINVDPHGFVI